jgi:hypothetical protein
MPVSSAQLSSAFDLIHKEKPRFGGALIFCAGDNSLGEIMRTGGNLNIHFMNKTWSATLKRPPKATDPRCQYSQKTSSELVRICQNDETKGF